VTVVKSGVVVTGTLSVSVTVFDPMRVAPLYVSVTIDTAPERELGISVRSVSGGVHVVLVPTPVSITPDWEPKTYEIVCVKLSLARFVIISTATPASTAVTGVPLISNVGVDALGIVARAIEPDLLALPIDDPVADAETDTVFVPSSL
jgi:hypothetical protein